jgi:CBS domain-containing protein
MNNVAEIIKLKGNEVFTISPNITVFDALKILAEKNIGALIVTKNDKVVGIFSERDYARKIILKGKSSIVTTVSELMTTNVLYVSPADSIDDCIDLMSDNHIRHLPVLEEEKLVAIISIGDVVKHIIKHQKFQIRELEKYIKGGYRL